MAEAPPPRGSSRLLRALLFAVGGLLALEATTGFSLALVFSPSTTHAWSSVAWFERAATWGPFVRALHHHVSTALVLCALAALLVALWRGAYRFPRAGIWICGLLAFGLVLSISHTGELLPADQRAYAATLELFSILGSVPWVGSALVALVRGGPRYGHLTLTHLYAFHVLLLPWLLAAVALLAFALSRRARSVNSASASDASPSGRKGLGLELAFALGVLLAVAVAALLRDAPLWAPADPSAHFPARPEWYFLPIFQLRRHLGRAEILATLVLPGLAFAALCLLPWVEEWARRRGVELRRSAGGAALVGVVVAAGIGLWSVKQDRRDPKLSQLRSEARKNASEALRLARLGTPPRGPLALYLNDPVAHGKHLFERRCESCHAACDTAPDRGAPCLQGYGSRAWLAAMLKHPVDPYFFGHTKLDGMDPYPPEGRFLPELVELLYAQTGAKDVDEKKAARGKKAFEDEGCESCHGMDGQGSGIAPDLLGWGSAGWLSAFIRNPAAVRFYGDDNHMKAFPEHSLSESELKAVVAYLGRLRRRALPVKFLLPASSNRGSFPPPEVPRR